MIKGDTKFEVTTPFPGDDQMTPWFYILKEQRFQVYRYYDKEGEPLYEGIPDIITTLDEKIDELEKVFDDWRLANVRGTDYKVSRFIRRYGYFNKPTDLKKLIDRFYVLRDQVLDGKEHYYTLRDPDPYRIYGQSTDSELRPVVLGKATVYCPVFNEHTMKWEPSKPFEVDALQVDGYLYIQDDTYELMTIGSYINSSFNKLIACHKEDIDICLNDCITWHVCKTCKNPFPLTEGERDWYTSRGWKTPSNCTNCRKAKHGKERG